MKNKKILITGSNGFLGSNLADYFYLNGYEICGTDLHDSSLNKKLSYRKGDLADREFVERLFEELRPQVVINTVALVDLDICETDRNLAYKINVQTTENIAKCSKNHDVRMIHISTDHLFDGLRSFYSEEDKTFSINNYGLTKLMGEQACLSNQDNAVSVRTNFYGWSHPNHKPTFGEWMYESLTRKTPIRLLTDYYFTPIEVTALAGAIELVMKSNFTGLINIAGTQRCSKYEFGMAMAEVFGLDTSSVTPVKMQPDSFKVKRQQDLSLSIKKFSQIFGLRLPDLKTGLQRFKNTKPKDYKKI